MRGHGIYSPARDTSLASRGDGTSADPAPVWTLAGRGGEEPLGAALAPQTILPLHCCGLGEAKCVPKGPGPGTGTRITPGDTRRSEGWRCRHGPRCSTQRFRQHPRGCLELHKPPQGLSTASLFRWALGEVFLCFSLDCKQFLFPNREGSASQHPLCNGALFRCLHVPDMCQRLQEKTRILHPPRWGELAHHHGARAGKHPGCPQAWRSPLGTPAPAAGG